MSGAHTETATETGREEAERTLLTFAQRLVATPSLPGEEHTVSRLVADELARLGYHDIDVDDVGNVVAWYGRGPAKLMFNGHLDHVPPAGMEDPYCARLVPGEAYGTAGEVLRGRGSCDMKANVAAGAYAVAFLPPGAPAAGSYLFTADVQEETDSPAGVRALIDRGICAEFGLSGESTDLAVYLGHRGKARFDVTVSGRASHASTPEAGLNAVLRAAPFLKAIEKAGRSLGSDPLLGRGTMTVTGISSEPDTDVAVVPSSCTIRVDHRYLPSESAESCLTELRTLVANVSRSESIDAAVELLDDYPLMEIDRSHALVQAGTDAVAAITGREARVGAWRFGVNATFMSAAGIPCIGIGPGNEDWAHTSDEHVPVAQLVDSSRIYAALLARLAGA